MSSGTAVNGGLLKNEPRRSNCVKSARIDWASGSSPLQRFRTKASRSSAGSSTASEKMASSVSDRLVADFGSISINQDLQSGSGKTPTPPHRPDGDGKNRCTLIFGIPREPTQFHNASFVGMLARKLLHCPVDRQDLVGIFFGLDQVVVVAGPKRQIALGRFSGTCSIHQEAPHDTRDKCAKMRTVVQRDASLRKTQVSLMQQAGRPQGTALRLVT